MLQLAETLRENRRRLREINRKYDPETGEGSLVDRRLVHIEGFPFDMYLPIDFADTPFVKELEKIGAPGFLNKYTGSGPVESAMNELWMEFCIERKDYDFEFWAYVCAVIEARVKEGSGGDVPFKLNRPQRKYLKKLEKLRLSGAPIDIILLKARQWGGSTLTQIYMVWIQLVHRVNWHSVICGAVENQSRIVTGMLQKVIDNYPGWASDTKVETNPFQGSSKTRVISTTRCRYSVGSAEKPENLRSDHISMAHLTEVGVWRKTKGKSPEDLVQSIFGSISSGPYTMKVLESTAKGVGNYFHRTWIDAVAGKNNFHPVFIAWFDIDEYSTPIPKEEIEDFIKSLSSYEEWLFSLGATLEAINWYRAKSKEMSDPWRMKSEYPSTPEEAFQSTGNRVFLERYVESARSTCIDPCYFGDIISRGLKGKDALEGVRFVERAPKNKNEDNIVRIWQKPEEEVEYRNQYVVSVDPGGSGENSDPSCIRVFNRLPMLEVGGVPEVVAEWHGHLEHDLMIWLAVRMAIYYGNAHLVVEANTLETEGTEGDNFEYILEEIKDWYDNLYSRTSAQQIREGKPVKYGFHTNTSTKPVIIKHLIACLRDDLYIERSLPVTFEMDTFEYKPDGKKTGAVDGCHDDYVMSTAIGVYVCYKTDLPSLIKKTSARTINPKVVSEASI